MVPILFISHSKILGCDRLPPLKEISSLRFGEARKKDRFVILGGLPPLKETFVGSLGLGFRWAHLGFDLAPGHLPLQVIFNGKLVVHPHRIPTF
jgi:hypothetical protein